MTYLLLLFLLLLGYFLYEKVYKMYAAYFYYKRQGVPVLGFPIPIFGTALKLIKNIK